jgi:hypothetical protein
MAVRRIAREDVPTDRSIEGQRFAATFASFEALDREDTWHHHGEHDIVAFLIAGSITVEIKTREFVLTDDLSTRVRRGLQGDRATGTWRAKAGGYSMMPYPPTKPSHLGSYIQPSPRGVRKVVALDSHR